MSIIRDSWEHWRSLTGARIGLGRAGGSRTTAEVLAFRLDHARAVDAVYAPFAADAMCLAGEQLGLMSVIAMTQVGDRDTYLRRPDLGRRLAPESAVLLPRQVANHPRVVLTIADGLSAIAVHKNAPLLLQAIVPLLRDAGLVVDQLIVTPFARVALQDEVGELLGATAVLTMIGERPGLGTAESMGLYLVYSPKVGNTDAARNCISNVREGGLSPVLAAHKAAYLLSEAIRQQISGVALKDESGRLTP